MESKVIKIYAMPERKCLRCNSVDHMVDDCPERTENFKNYQVNAIQKKIEEEAEKKAKKHPSAKRTHKQVEEIKDGGSNPEELDESSESEDNDNSLYTVTNPELPKAGKDSNASSKKDRKKYYKKQNQKKRDLKEQDKTRQTQNVLLSKFNKLIESAEMSCEEDRTLFFKLVQRGWDHTD